MQVIKKKLVNNKHRVELCHCDTRNCYCVKIFHNGGDKNKNYKCDEDIFKAEIIFNKLTQNKYKVEDGKLLYLGLA